MKHYHKWRIITQNLEDLIRIRNACWDCGIDIVSLGDAQEFWEFFSNRRDAQWINVPPEYEKLKRLITAETAGEEATE